MNNRTFGKASGPSAEVPAARTRTPRSRFFDARRTSCQRPILPGKLYLGRAVHPIDCVIGDMSTSGARIRVKPGSVVPNELHLVHMSEWTAYSARVVWRRADGNIGLAFKRSHELKGAIGAELRVMREYCAAIDN